MTIKTEMQQRRENKKETVKDELQREVEKVKGLAFELQEYDWARLCWNIPVWESGEYKNITETSIEEVKNITLSFETKVQMQPKTFRVFLQEKLAEEGIILTDMKKDKGAEIIISLK